MRLRYRAALTGVLIFILCAAAYGASVPDAPQNYVTDLAGVIDDDSETRINGLLKQLEDITTAQIFVLTLDTLDGMSVEDYSLDVAEKWKPGQKGKDNGMLLLIAMKERKYRVEVGYGLEGVIPDSLAGSIGRQYLAPYFKRGDYSGGVTASALAMAGEVARASGVELTGMPEMRPTMEINGKKPDIMTYIFGALFFLVMAYLFIKHPWLMLLLLFSGGGHRRSNWGGGGGFGGGGFGGFGGGGGGGFGGGGASGGW